MSKTSQTETHRQFPVECQWFHRLVNKRSFKIAVCTVVCILNVIDLLIDWWFFVSKTTIREVILFCFLRQKKNSIPRFF